MRLTYSEQQRNFNLFICLQQTKLRIQLTKSLQLLMHNCATMQFDVFTKF